MSSKSGEAALSWASEWGKRPLPGLSASWESLSLSSDSTNIVDKKHRELGIGVGVEGHRLRFVRDKERTVAPGGWAVRERRQEV